MIAIIILLIKFTITINPIPPSPYPKRSLTCCIAFWVMSLIWFSKNNEQYQKVPYGYCLNLHRYAVYILRYWTVTLSIH